MIIEALALATFVLVKDIKSFEFGEFTRIAIEMREKIDFNFSAGEKYIKIIFNKDIITSKAKKHKNFDIEINGKVLKINFGKQISFAKYFVIPFPYKIIVDVSFAQMEIEDIIQSGEKKLVIVIDPGHGGKDPGAVFGNLREKDITLKTAKLLYELIKEDGKFDVFMTRDSDKFLELEERSALANSLQCDVFISIHVNSAPSYHAHGTEIFYFSKNYSKYAMKVASKENGIKPNEDFPIVFDISTDFKEDESKELADLIAREFWNKGEKVRTKEGAPLYVLAGTYCTAVLVEIGFITNPLDREKLQSESFLKKIAIAIYNAIRKYNFKNSI